MHDLWLVWMVSAGSALAESPPEGDPEALFEAEQRHLAALSEAVSGWTRCLEDLPELPPPPEGPPGPLRAWVSLSLGADGALASAEIAHGSGEAAFDACVLDVLRGATFPPPPPHLLVAGRADIPELAFSAASAAGLIPELPVELPECLPRSFPGEAWPDRTEEAPQDAVVALDAHLFPPGLDRSARDRAGVRTDGAVIVWRGAVVYERYGGPYRAETPHLAWSATKSFTNALVGIAVREGKVSLDDTICDHLDRVGPDACKVRVRDLLEFASGFDWRETYEGQSPRASSVLAMLYGEGSRDMARFAADHPLKDPPGTSWRYSSGDANVLSAIAGAALSGEHGERFPFVVLLDRIGMTSATWERDASGTYVGSSYLWATPQDLARFGYLLLADGCWDGRRLLDAGWIDASTQVSDAIRSRAHDRDPGDVQGRQFWLNRTVPEQGQTTLPWPSAPEGAFAAQGHWHQSITVIPSEDLVVVRTADDRDQSYDHDRTLALALDLARAMAARDGGDAP